MKDQELLESLKYERVSARKIRIPINSLEMEPFKPTFFKAVVGEPYSSGKRKSKGELECKKVLESYYAKKFECYRPDWLNYKGYNLELDLFNPELGLACEYHGKQHYEYPSRFIKKKALFLNQLRRDLFKLEKCKELGIFILVVPHECKKIKEYIETKLEQINN